MNFLKRNHEDKASNKNVVRKKLNITTAIMAIVFISITAISCKDGKSTDDDSDGHSTEMTSAENLQQHSTMHDSIKTTMVHDDHQMNKQSPLTMPGNEIFGTIQEVVQKLKADPNTDWSKVDLEALRQHLLDMKAFTENVSVISQKPIEKGIVIQVKPENERAIVALKRLFKMHPAMLKMEKGWDMITKQDNNQWTITITTEDNSEVEEIRALGYIGLLADGAHHQLHHWMVATGHMKMP